MHPLDKCIEFLVWISFPALSSDRSGSSESGNHWPVFSDAPTSLQRKGSPVLLRMAFIAKTFYDLKATTLDGDLVDFNVYRGRVVLIENVASL